MPTSATWLPERYRLLERIGAGGMGEVWLARDGERGRTVAVKRFMLAWGGAGEADRLRFKREFLILSKLEAPGVVRVFEAGEAGDSLYYTMEHVAGWPLRDYFLNGHWRSGGGPTPAYFNDPAALALVWRAGERILAALSHLHANSLVHRDLKPGNLLATREGEIKLIDFGLAREQAGASPITLAGEVMGTPNYLAPEQIRAQPLDGRADLYSLGVILYELATGRPPFSARGIAEILMAHLQQAPPPPRESNPLIPPAAGALILRLLAKSPAGRPASAREALRALSAAIAAGSGTDDPLAPTGRMTAGPVAEATAALPPAGAVLVAPYIGNEAVRDAILESCRALLGGEGGAVLVSGPSGSGKSRLKDEARAFAAEHGLVLARGGGVAAGGTAGQLFQDLFAHFAGRLERDPRAASEWPADAAATLAARFPALRRVGAFSTLPPPPELAPEGERARLLSAAYQVFAAEAARAPLALWLDDLQWADPLSLDLLAHLLHSFTGGGEGDGGRPQLLLLGNCRDDAPSGEPFGRWLSALGAPRLNRLALRPLSEAELARLVQALLGLPAAPPADFVRRLGELTGGNPYFATETVKGLVAGGKLARDADEGWSFSRWTADRSQTLASLPETVHAVLAQRLSQVGDGAVETLRTAAVIGRRFHFAWWRRMTGLDEDALLDVADRAIAAGLIAETGGEILQFSHDQLRAALLAGLSGLKRRRLHARAVEAIAAGGGEAASLELLAEHALEAAQPEPAARYALPAAARLLDLGQLDGAGALLARLESLLAAGEQLSPAAHAELLGVKLRLVTRRADYRASAGIAPAAISAARAAGRRDLEMKSLRMQGVVEMRTGRYPAAFSSFESALSLARAAGEPGEEAFARRGMGDVRLYEGRLDEAEREFAAAEALARGAGHDRSLVLILNSRSLLVEARGDFRAAEELCRQTRAIYRRLGDVSGDAICAGNLGGYAICAGRLEEAEAAIREAAERNRALGQVFLLALNHGDLGHLMALRGEWTAAESMSDQAVRFAARAGPEEDALVRQQRVRMRLWQGRHAQAAQELELARAAASRSGRAPLRLAQCAVLTAALAYHRGDPAGARAAADAALAATEGKYSDHAAHARALRAAADAVITRACDDPAFTGATAAAAATGDRELLLAIRLLHGRALSAAGRTAEAEAVLAAARELASGSGMTVFALEADAVARPAAPLSGGAICRA